MSDSAERPVSVELPLSVWLELLITTTGATRHDEILEQIEDQLPMPFPTGLGAVIAAQRENHAGAAQGVLYLVRTDTRNREPDFLHWREAGRDGEYWAESDLRVTEILSNGVDGVGGVGS